MVEVERLLLEEEEEEAGEEERLLLEVEVEVAEAEVPHLKMRVVAVVVEAVHQVVEVAVGAEGVHSEWAVEAELEEARQVLSVAGVEALGMQIQIGQEVVEVSRLRLAVELEVVVRGPQVLRAVVAVFEGKEIQTSLPPRKTHCQMVHGEPTASAQVGVEVSSSCRLH